MESLLAKLRSTPLVRLALYAALGLLFLAAGAGWAVGVSTLLGRSQPEDTIGSPPVPIVFPTGTVTIATDPNSTPQPTPTLPPTPTQIVLPTLLPVTVTPIPETVTPSPTGSPARTGTASVTASPSAGVGTGASLHRCRNGNPITNRQPCTHRHCEHHCIAVCRSRGWNAKGDAHRYGRSYRDGYSDA